MSGRAGASAARRQQVILPLLARAPLPNALVEEVGRRHGVSGRSVRRWLARYRAGGTAALANAPRRDRGRQRSLDQRLIALVRQIYLQPSRPTVAAVYRQVCAHCQEQGRPAPSYCSVWRCCLALPAEEVCRAREGEATYLARYGLPVEHRLVRPAPPLPRLRRPRRIAMIAPETCAYFWQQVRAGVAAARAVVAGQGSEVEWIVASERLDGERIALALDQAVRAGYDAVGVVGHSGRVDDSIWKATRKGILVATFVSDTGYGEDAGAIFYHGQDGAQAGEIAARLLVSHLPDRGSVAVVTGSRDVPAHEARRAAFERYVRQHSELEIIGPFFNHDSEAAMAEIVGHLVRRLPDLRGIYVTNALTWTAARVVEQAGRCGQVKIVGYDLLPPTLRCLRQGAIVAAIDQDPFGQGYDTVVWLHNALMGGWEAGPYHRYTRTRVVEAARAHPTRRA